MNLPPLILASASPRRRSLLQEIGCKFTVEPADVPESAPEYFSPGEITLRNARTKAHAVAARHPRALVLGVDTEVIFDGEVFGKPADLDAALAMVERLRGRMHLVCSGLWLCHYASHWEHGLIDVTRVYFRHLNRAQIRAYHQRISPLDKAGAYAAQDDDGELIERVEGSFTNVIGLPVETLARALAAFPGAARPRPKARR